MSFLSTVGRMALSTIFIQSGVTGLQNRGDVAAVAADAGLPEPTTLETARHATNAVAGATLALGIFPRLSAFALAANLVPATVLGHKPADADDEQAKQAQTIHAAKNISLLGALLMVLGGADDDPVVVEEPDELPLVEADEIE